MTSISSSRLWTLLVMDMLKNESFLQEFPLSQNFKMHKSTYYQACNCYFCHHFQGTDNWIEFLRSRPILIGPVFERGTVRSIRARACLICGASFVVLRGHTEFPFDWFFESAGMNFFSVLKSLSEILCAVFMNSERGKTEPRWFLSSRCGWHYI